MSDSAHRYRPDVDGLRAVAVALVVLYHAFPGQVPGGYIGVDVFFVISGFLITRIILQDHQAGIFSFLNFYARRFRRILPALLLVLVAVWGFGWFALLGEEFRGLGRHVAAGALFLSNFQLYREAGYFDLAAEAKPLLHLWSLSVEEQYYLLYPLLLALLLRARARVAWWMGGIGALSFAFNVACAHAWDGLFAFYFLPSRFWELLLGGLIALAPPREERIRSWQADGLAVLALGALAVAAFRLQPSGLYPGWLALVPTLAAVLCVSSGGASWILRAGLGHPAMVTLGKMSYALYLWHWPLLSFARIVQEGEPSVGQRVTLIAVSLGLAWLTWRCVEVRARRYGLPPSDPRPARKAIAWSLAGLGVVFVLGAVTYVQQGYPARHPHLEPASQPAVLHGQSCVEKHATPGAFCSETAAAPRMAVIGDSFADALYRGLVAGGSPVARSLILLGANSCPYLTDVTADVHPDCLQYTRRVDAILAGLPSVQSVVLVVRGPRYLSPEGAYDGRYQPDRQWPLRGLAPDTVGLPAAALLEAGLSRTIAKLEQQGRTVVLVAAWPELDFDPAACADARPLRFWPVAVKAPCAMPVDAVWARQAEFRELLAGLQARHPRLRLFDPVPFLCDAGNCWAAREGKPLYRDRSHLNAQGVAAFAPVLAQEAGAR